MFCTSRTVCQRHSQVSLCWYMLSMFIISVQYIVYIYGFSRRWRWLAPSFPNCRASAWAQVLLVRYRDAPCTAPHRVALHRTAPSCCAHLGTTNGPCTASVCVGRTSVLYSVLMIVHCRWHPFNHHFPGHCTPDVSGAKDVGGGGDSWSIRHAKFQSNRCH